MDTYTVSLGSTITIWMKFLVPKHASYDDVLVEYKYGDIAWHVTPYKVECSIRYRIVYKYKPNKPGKWIICILEHEPVSSLNSACFLTIYIFKPII